MNVYLVGMPGSGKTAVAERLARRLDIGWVDLDAEVERSAGSSIPEIFAQRGEAGFRTLEAVALAGAAAGTAAVVACGGGIVVDQSNREILRGSGTVVWLSVPLAELRSRVAVGGARPLLRRPEDLERLFAEREPLYREVAHLVVDAAGEPERVAAAIEDALVEVEG